MNEKELTLAGMDVQDFLSRLMQNTALVNMFVKKFIEDKNFENLKAAIAAGDMKAAETACHTLKGMCGNMSLKSLFALFQAQLALFRAGDYAKAVAAMDEIVPLYENAIAHMQASL